MTLITNGDFDYESIVRIDTEGGWVYYIGTPDSPIDRYLYRSRLDGKGEPERLTPADAPAGHHYYNISPDAKYAMHTFSNSETPTVYEIVTLPRHKTVRVLEDNHELAAKFAALELNPKEFFRVDIGEVVLDGWISEISGHLLHLRRALAVHRAELLGRRRPLEPVPRPAGICRDERRSPRYGYTERT